MNTEQVSVTWFQAAKSRLNNQNWTVSAWRGLLVARVSVVSEGAPGWRRTDGKLAGESKSVANTNREADEGMAGTRRHLQSN